MKRKFRSSEYIPQILLAVIITLFIIMPFAYVFKEGFFIDGKFTTEIAKKVLEGKGKILRDSVTVAILVSLFTTFISVCIGIFVYLGGNKIRKSVNLLLLITMISPPFVTSMSFITLFGRRGLISYRLLHITSNPYGMHGVIMMQVLGFISIHALMIISALKSINTDSIKSARDLGAKTHNIILDVILPAIKPMIIAVAFLTFIRSMADFSTPAIIGGNFSTLATESYYSVISKGDINESAILNILILLPSLIAFAFYGKFFHSTQSSQEGDGNLNSSLNLKNPLFILISVISVFFLLWLLIQYASVIFSAFSRMEMGKLVVTLNNFKDTVPYIDSAVLRSIIYSLVTALVGCILSLIISYYLVIRKSRIMKYLDFAQNLPYIIPGTFFGLGYLLFFSRGPIKITGTAAIVILNILFKQLPFSSRVLNSSMKEIDEGELNSARDLGAGRYRQFIDIVLPNSMDAFFVSFAAAFTASMTTVGSIIFLITPGQKVLTMVMFEVLSSGKYEIGSVIALLIILICLTVNMLFRYLQRRENYAVRS